MREKAVSCDPNETLIVDPMGGPSTKSSLFKRILPQMVGFNLS